MDCQYYTSDARYLPQGLQQELRIRVERKNSLSGLFVLWAPQETMIPCWLHKKRKNGTLPSRHARKKPSRSLNWNWTCACGLRECDRCTEIEIKKNNNNIILVRFLDIQNAFTNGEHFSANSVGKSVSTSHRSCHAELYEQEYNPHHFIFFSYIQIKHFCIKWQPQYTREK